MTAGSWERVRGCGVGRYRSRTVPPHGSSGTVSVRIPCDDLRETVVRDGGAERQTASEAFGEGVQTIVIESAVGTDHGSVNDTGYKTRSKIIRYSPYSIDDTGDSMSRREEPKPRTRIITATIHSDEGCVATLSYDGRRMTATKEDGTPLQIESISSDLFYHNDLGKRKHVFIDRTSEVPTLNMDEVLFGYDLVFAVDTNTNPHVSPNTSAGVMVQVLLSRVDGGIHYEFRPELQFKCDDTKGWKMEPLGWKASIEHIMKTHPEGKIALIVDSEQGRLDAFNKREEPITENFYLPPGFYLLYADSRKKDTIANRAMDCCDRMARLI